MTKRKVIRSGFGVARARTAEAVSQTRSKSVQPGRAPATLPSFFTEDARVVYDEIRRLQARVAELEAVVGSVQEETQA